MQQLRVFSFHDCTVIKKTYEAKVAVRQILLGSVFQVADAPLLIVSVFEDGLIGNR